MKCLYCKESLQNKNKKAKFCSNKCRIYYWREQKSLQTEKVVPERYKSFQGEKVIKV